MLHALYHAKTETIGIIGKTLKKYNLPFQECCLYSGAKLPVMDENFTGLIVMGGPMNVDETHIYPFLKNELDLIEKAIVKGKPVLGICLGAQLIAKALGSKVYANKFREVGWHPVFLSKQAKQDMLFASAPDNFDVLHWHGDTFYLPAGASHIASSEKCENQAFRWGNQVYGLQFHLEVTPKMLEEWVLAEDAAHYIREAGEDAGRILKETPSRFARLEPIANKIFENFFTSVPNT